MSGRFLEHFQDGARLFAPATRNVTGSATGVLAWSLAAWRRRLARFDLAKSLIGFADAAEALIARCGRMVRVLMRHRGFGVTGGLAWRGLAALTGIGLTATLVTALSVDEGDNRLASLTVAPVQEARPIRDVRLEPRPLPSAGDGWIRVAQPVVLFALESPELDRHSLSYEAQRTQDGAHRLDTLVFGGFGSDRAHLQLRALVDHRSAPHPQPFVIALVREASERGMSVQRSGVPGAVETKFGTLETADVTLSDGAASRQCIGFRKPHGDGTVALSGWWCGSAQRAADRQQLACLIDRLELVGSVDDAVLRTAFARQPVCAPPRLASSAKKGSWLDADGKAPVLKATTKR